MLWQTARLVNDALEKYGRYDTDTVFKSIGDTDTDLKFKSIADIDTDPEIQKYRRYRYR